MSSLTLQSRLLKCKSFLKVKTKLGKLQSKVSNSEHGLKTLDQNQQDIVQHCPDELMMGYQGGDIMEIEDVGMVTSEERAKVPCNLVTASSDTDNTERMDWQVPGESTLKKTDVIDSDGTGGIDSRGIIAVDPKGSKDMVPNGIVDIDPEDENGPGKSENKHDPKLFKKVKIICERIDVSKYLPLQEVSNEGGKGDESISNNPGDDSNIGRDCNPKITEEEEWKPLICDICFIALGNKTDLDIHIKSHSVQYECIDCYATFSDSEKFKEHIRTHALPPTKPISCCECSKIFSTMSGRRKHIRKKHVSHGHSSDCEKCLKILKYKKLVGNQTNLESQTKSHSIQYECIECDATFPDFEKSMDHIRTHHALPPAAPPKHFSFSCCTCPKSFAAYQSRQKHIRLAHTSHSWNCKECLKISKQNKCPEESPATFSNAPKFQCPQCTKSIKTKKGLKAHLARHSNFFNCDLCSSIFPDHSSLEDHLREHFGGANPEKSNRSVDDAPDMKLQPYRDLNSHHKVPKTPNLLFLSRSIHKTVQSEMKRYPSET